MATYNLYLGVHQSILVSTPTGAYIEMKWYTSRAFSNCTSMEGIIGEACPHPLSPTLSTMINYYSYIRSQEWKKKKWEFLARKFFWKCMCCAEKMTAYEVEIHHLRYDNLWRERMNDLVAICRSCHDAIHFDEWKKLELTPETTWWWYSKLRFKLQSMHNKRIQEAKEKNEKLRNWKKSWLAKNLARKERKRKARLNQKWSHPNFDKEKKKFVVIPYKNSVIREVKLKPKVSSIPTEDKRIIRLEKKLNKPISEWSQEMLSYYKITKYLSKIKT